MRFRSMTVSEALQETLAGLERIADTVELNSAEARTLADSIAKVEDALQMLGGMGVGTFPASNPRTKATKPKRKRKKLAYQIWAEKERPKIVKQHPRFDFGRVQKELGIRWRRKQRKGGKK